MTRADLINRLVLIRRQVEFCIQQTVLHEPLEEALAMTDDAITAIENDYPE